MRKRIVVLGGGTGGTLAANRLRRLLDRDAAEITVVDQDDATSTSRGCCSCRSGWPARRDLRPRDRQLHDGIGFRRAADRPRRPGRANGGAPGRRSRLALRRAGRRHRRPADPGGDRRAHRAGLDGEGLHLLHARRRGRPRRRAGAVRRRPARGQRGRHADQVPGRAAGVLLPGRLVLHRARHPRPGPADLRHPARRRVHQARRRRQLGGMLADKGIELVTEFNTGEVDGAGGRLVAYDGREVPFDLAVVIPLHGGAAYVEPLARAWATSSTSCPTDPHTLQSRARAEHVRDRRRRRRPRLQGRLGDPLRGRDPGQRTSAASSPASRSTPASTGTPTASSRPGSTRPCSSTSTTTPSRCPGTTRPRSGCPLLQGVTAQPPRQADVPAGSTGTACCPAVTSPASAADDAHRRQAPPQRAERQLIARQGASP